mgnify:CR=1 FL=1
MAQSISINKWGTSLGIRIPSYVAHSLDLKAGDKVRLHFKENIILLEVNKTNEKQFEEWLELFGRGEAPADFDAWQQTKQ